eukprot:CAMPEP_0194043578 /NCGR_PEP_ID=MMETSP0009_2-20130614/15177_1 /TAXON_ID=210454 /ORGANISM="Grammatophora oceanica, Strain CCMP 410" /LENGTH=369 /DNA_ID=CAMNT_0038687829 /DNA_START=210 /DNA_END=1316 /DNA_ORIENTATION=+
MKLLQILGLLLGVVGANGSDYAMYVWTRSFDAFHPDCNGLYPPERDSPCFSHNWETPEARKHLWASCRATPGREVTRIFLADVWNRIKYSAGEDFLCDAALETTLNEAKARGIEVYALFADSTEAFSEKEMALAANQFNDNCGASFDGVAVNNEYFSQVRGCDNAENQAAQLKTLDDLKQTAQNASPMPLHFSVSWNWECCDCSDSSYRERTLTWDGKTKSALSHMIDIVDSVDVQVAYNLGSTMADRSETPYQYWDATKAGTTSSTQFYVLAYANPNESLCQLSFAPHLKGATEVPDICTKGNSERTEASMYQAFDEVVTAQPSARGGIHYHGGVYSTGMVGWPKHECSDDATWEFVKNNGKVKRCNW